LEATGLGQSQKAAGYIRERRGQHHQHKRVPGLDRYADANENFVLVAGPHNGLRRAQRAQKTLCEPAKGSANPGALERTGYQGQSSWLVLDNAHVRVTRNAAPCASPTADCRHRVFVALGDVLVASYWQGREFEGPNLRKLRRGDVVVYGPRDSYSPPTDGEFLEVTIKSARPAIASPPVIIAPDKNSILHDADEFFVFEEKLDPGDTRARHSHRERVVIVLNQTRLQQWPEGAPELFRDQIPDDVRFNPPVVHVVKTVGAQRLRNIVIEFKK
jgi:hypothetical protein